MTHMIIECPFCQHRGTVVGQIRFRRWEDGRRTIYVCLDCMWTSDESHSVTFRRSVRKAVIEWEKDRHLSER